MNSESDKDKFNPFSFVAILLYYPALGFAIRMGFSMYYILFENVKGFNIVLALIVTLIITIVFIIIALSFINLLLYFSDKIFLFINKK
jgi:hypothetical protein